MQAGDDAHVGAAKQRIDLALVVVANGELHRFVAGAAVPFVDFVGEPYRFGLQRMVRIEFAACRRGGLDKDELALLFRPTDQEVVDGADAVKNALGIVEPFDADGDTDIVGQPVLFA